MHLSSNSRGRYVGDAFEIATCKLNIFRTCYAATPGPEFGHFPFRLVNVTSKHTKIFLNTYNLFYECHI
jgi:hypothetical protein